ncbi:hypothetical protein Cni_G22128 [Canna indica]|uniref:Reverse transcriptase zinc-binding domain-containing protein n=1 Tax=Canna indica TaxID=4628 RepID=A0AAQ3KUJ9_9LILI|nr:hypothetical protein Cni_G22128 [Canna indica]
MGLIKNLFGHLQMENICQLYILKQWEEDKWIWSLNAKGKLNCKIAYNYLKGIQIEEKGPDLNWNSLWGLNVLPRIKIFAWELLWGRLPTSSYVSKFSKINPSSCYLCKKEEDNLSHIFFKCPFSGAFWDKAELLLNYKFTYRDK